MDAVSDPAVHTVVVMSSAQVGKTEIILNALGFYIDQDPAPILLLQPTLDMGQAFSKDRLAPMLRDTPALQGRVADAKARDSGNTMLHKTFPGGHVTIAGANSAASLASRPIRVLLADEVDRYPSSAGTEGDPVSLARKRTTTFWNRKVVLVSTPTVRGHSRIEAAYEESDQRRFHVPCPDCGHEAPLAWDNVRWPEGQPREAYYACPECGSVWDDAKRWRACRAGRWVAGAEFNGVAGFHLSELYSPWRKLGETAQDFWDAKAHPERLQTWVNTALGETWEDRAGVLDDGELMERAEPWGLESAVPGEARVLTAGVDVQHDRFEVSFYGWTEEGQQLALGHEVVYGEITDPADGAWGELDDLLKRRWPHALGGKIGLDAACVDSSDGATNKAVLEFCRARARRRVMAIKGEDGFRRPIIERSRGAQANRLWIVGSDTGKSQLFARLSRRPGEGEAPEEQPVRFSKDLPPVWFEQLVGERIVTTTLKSRPVRRFEPIPGRRNEALDCTVYAMAARATMGAVDWDQRRAELAVADPETIRPKPQPAEGGWITVRDGWL